MKILITIILLSIAKLVAQPIPNHYNFMAQKDSLYYLLTDNSLLKFYSHEASGEFFLTKYLEGTFPTSTKYTINDDYFFLSYNDSVFYYSNRYIDELSFENVFVPGFTVTSIHGFGPYFFIRSGNTYHLFKVVNGIVVLVEDSLFNHPSQELVFFVYPYVTIAQTVYKYVEGFDFYPVGQINIGNGNTGLTGNTLVAYYFWVTPPIPGVIHSELHKTLIEEPSFPDTTIYWWGYNIPELQQNYGWGTLIAKKNLYFMMWVGVITTYNSQLAYLPTTEDRVNISDYYIFKLGGDTLLYSKWNAGSTFYPFTWTNYTYVENEFTSPTDFALFQNYPNPFNPITKIRYELPERSFVIIKVYDVLGKEITTLVNDEKPNGNYEVEFNGNGLASGIYYYRITAGDFSQTKKMILLK
ncbi:MAG: T9SS type A sorting domain-containing protein [Ignavibacteriaceae bacterium]|jgi:hypothetical protein|nr:T9SS type A sorting domain-containing protein [Ignavibacteriaceae bacterium]MCW8812553.1 T9SS type A sorting domain-containing protein [Chlorobium sp.]MCW8996292.1 T9SS type A sorting domain-containing protein [Psychromonas sp.]MCW8818149.1 T9SS type A sorting domain-containing protein [Ignavibacteriaceae bacterium]MCW8824178.1 T9SS type A sorting domain-containing protein [Ignavibacteriaceae bacterium]